MKLAVMQPYFMPYLGYFQAIKAVDKYILYENLTYILNGWMNRNRIRTRNSPANFLIVPVNSKSSNSLISNVKIDNTQDWKSKILETITFAYKKSPFFDELYPLLQQMFSLSFEYLYDLNAQTIISLCRFLDIETQIKYQNQDYLTMETNLILMENGDYSSCEYLLKTKPIKKVARAINMCKIEEADIFINAIGGQELYNAEEFKKYNIELKFIQMNNIVYSQYSKDFIPNLSIIDVLMYNGRNKTIQLLNEYTLI